jgi:hypothetical protein
MRRAVWILSLQLVVACSRSWEAPPDDGPALAPMAGAGAGSAGSAGGTAGAAGAAAPNKPGHIMRTRVIAVGSDLQVGTDVLIPGEVMKGLSGDLPVGLDGISLTAFAGDMEMPMMAWGNGYYEATFAGVAPDAEIRVRSQPGSKPPVNGSGTVPAAFVLRSDSEGASVSRTKPITLQWEPSGSSDTMIVRLDDQTSQGCINEQEVAIPGDPGTFVLGPGSLDTAGLAPSQCMVTIDLMRVRTGMSDPGLAAESEFKLMQIQRIEFVSTP